MHNYINEICPACGQPLLASDDIVVCPDCGAPHHRSCYQRLGHCACEQNHGDGTVWTGKVKETPPSDETIFCPNCGAQNPADGIFCANCGVKLHKSTGQEGPQQNPYMGKFAQSGRFAAYNSAYGPYNPEEEFDGVKVKEMAKFIGGNAPYFLSAFAVMRRNKRGLSWNWSSLFFNWRYYLYRKMYLFGILIFVVKMLLALPYSLCLYEEIAIAAGTMADYSAHFDTMLLFANICNILSSVLSVFLGLFFNRIYYRFCIKKIKKIREQVFISEQEYMDTLAKKGQVNLLLVGVMLMLYATFGMVVLPFLTL